MEEQRVLPIEQVARLIRGFSREQKLLLLHLVPELQHLRAEETDNQGQGNIPTEQTALISYFDQKLEALSEHRPIPDDASFLAGLTAAEFFAKPEMEQDRLWRQAHTEAMRALQDEEHTVNPDALSP